jgi:predicted nucleic acid-binding protein
MDKIKIYLDTNMILDFFINYIRHIKRKDDLIIPKKMKFMIDNLTRFHFFTSFLTKAEVVRELISSYNATKEEVEIIWTEFLSLLNCEYIENYNFDETIVEIAAIARMKLRTMINFQHLSIAKNLDAYLLSGDMDLVRICRKEKIYDKIISYIEFRQKFS